MLEQRANEANKIHADHANEPERELPAPEGSARVISPVADER